MTKILISAFLAFLICGCGSTRDVIKEPGSNDKENLSKSLKSSRDKQAINDESKQKADIMAENIRAMHARGFYVAPSGLINYYEDRVCANLELQSHRGLVGYPENSIESIKGALENNFDVVEIDVVPTRDGTWLLHHDEKTGRATGTVDNKRREISRIRDSEIRYVSHRNMETGELTKVRIPTLQSAMSVFKYMSRSDQLLNIEIKGSVAIGDLKKLEYMAFRTLLYKNYYFSSSEFKVLENMRSINPDVRLNYIDPADFDSLKIEKDKMKRGAINDPIYQREKRERGFSDSYTNQEKARRNYNKRIVTKNLDYFDQRIGPNYSVSKDIRALSRMSKSQRDNYKSNGVSLSTYSINGQKYHESVLSKLHTSMMPESVIIDDTVFGFCTMFGLPKKKSFKSDMALANKIYNLPLDLDLERLGELALYEPSGLYPSIGGSLSPYIKYVEKTSVRMVVGKKEEEVKFDLDSGKAIEVDLRKGSPYDSN